MTLHVQISQKQPCLHAPKLVFELNWFPIKSGWLEDLL